MAKKDFGMLGSLDKLYEAAEKVEQIVDEQNGLGENLQERGAVFLLVAAKSYAQIPTINSFDGDWDKLPDSERHRLNVMWSDLTQRIFNGATAGLQGVMNLAMGGGVELTPVGHQDDPNPPPAPGIDRETISTAESNRLLEYVRAEGAQLSKQIVDQLLGTVDPALIWNLTLMAAVKIHSVEVLKSQYPGMKPNPQLSDDVALKMFRAAQEGILAVVKELFPAAEVVVATAVVEDLRRN